MRSSFIFCLCQTALVNALTAVGNSTSSVVSACQSTDVVTLANGSLSTAVSPRNGTCPQTTSLPAASIYTPAPWLGLLPQTIVTYIESFVVSSETLYKTFSFAVPQSTAFAAYVAAQPSAVTVSVLSCPSNGVATTIVPAAAAPRTTTSPAAQIAGAIPNAGSGAVLITTLTSDYSTAYTTVIYRTLTQYYTNGAGATTSSSVYVASTTATSTVVLPTTLTLTSTVLAGASPTVDPVARVSPDAADTATSSFALFSNSSSIISATSSRVVGSGLPGIFNGAAGSSVSSLASSTSPASVQRMSSQASPSSQRYSSAAPPSAVSSSNSASASATASRDSTCPIGTIAVSATAPAPPAGTNVYNISGNAPYSIDEAELLSMISFPNGFNCKNKLVILQPGTAVPAIDTYSNTFIPVFTQDVVAGGVDIMLVSNPSISLAPVWQTAEYIAYAMDYANLVLKRPGTVIAWSQGNLNTQWAFKYWPSTRTNVTGRNYVAMSADYDGTILGTFLCEPISILTSGSGASLLDQFLTNGGLTSVLGALGINQIPTSPDGNTDPVAFKALLYSLVFTDAASAGASNATTSSSPVSITITSTGSPLPSQVLKRAVPFGSRDFVAARLEAKMKRNTLGGALGDLLSGVLSPIATELASIVTDPTTDLMQIFANLAKLVTDPAEFSLPPSGCVPSVWDQGYFSPFILKLAENSGDLAYVPTTSVFSLTDEVVEPQGVTGITGASAYMAGSNAGVVAPENIYIQDVGQCTVISSVAGLDFPPLITHEGVLASGMGVAAAILAVNSGSTVSYSEIVAAYGQSEACALISKYLTVADFLGNEATVPGALTRVTLNPGTTDPDAQFVSAEVALPAYAANY